MEHWKNEIIFIYLLDTHTNLSLNIPYLAPEVYTVPFTISDSSSPPRSTFINLPGNADTSADGLKCVQRGYGTRASEQSIEINPCVPACPSAAQLLFINGVMELYKWFFQACDYTSLLRLCSGQYNNTDTLYTEHITSYTQGCPCLLL